MGPLIVMIVMAFVGAVAVLCGWGMTMRVAGSSERRRRLTRWLLVALPSAGTYAFGCLIVYAVICGGRGVDVGLFGEFYVPLGQTLSLTLNDLSDNGLIVDNHNAPVLEDVSAIAENGAFIEARSVAGRRLRVDTETGRYIVSEPPFQVEANDASLETPYHFYLRKKWNLTDAIVLLILGLPALRILLRTVHQAWDGDVIEEP